MSGKRIELINTGSTRISDWEARVLIDERLVGEVTSNPLSMQLNRMFLMLENEQDIPDSIIINVREK